MCSFLQSATMCLHHIPVFALSGVKKEKKNKHTAFPHDNLNPIQSLVAVTFAYCVRIKCVNFLWKYHKQKSQKSQLYTELPDFHQCNQCSDKNTKQNITSMQQLYFIFLTDSPTSTQSLGFVVSCLHRTLNIRH